MRHFLLSTNHGSLVLTQREDDWVISCPHLATEIFVSSMPAACLSDASHISRAEAMRLLGDRVSALWRKKSPQTCPTAMLRATA